MRASAVIPLVALTFGLGGCGDRIADPASQAEPAAASPAQSEPLAASVTLEDGDGYTRGLGEKAGALIEIIRPDGWNGDLVLLMHGLRSVHVPVSLRDPVEWWIQPTVDDLLARGYGVALSSYRKNGLAVDEGTVDTRIAEATFISEFGRPVRTYLWGWSMGGAIGHQVLEHAPTRYDGLLSVCSDQVGSEVVHQYHLDARVLFDYFFPGALPWDIGTYEADLFTEVLPTVQAAFVADPAGFIEKVHEMATIDQLGLPLGNGSPGDLILAMVGSTLGWAGGAGDLVESLGGLPVGNVGRVYTSDVLDQAELDAINAGVARYTADPNAAGMLTRSTPTGRTRGTPILALHTDGDAVIPVWMPPLYEATAEAAGTADSYVLRAVPGFAHCGFPQGRVEGGFDNVQIQAFDDLVSWVEDGIKPAT
jgi:pimeloyl-ACP methyl ester carboxylesterase